MTGRRWSVRAAAAVAAAIVLASPLCAQRPAPLTLAGRVLHVGAGDTVPVPGLTVVAHRVGQARQGPLDSMPSNAAGRFRFRIAAPESGAVYVVAARWAGIGYFAEPYDAANRAGADSITLLVYDTASAGNPLAIATRHVVITRPSADGSRRILDIIRVRNTGTTTRVAGSGADSTAPTWRMRLPDGVANLAVGEGDVAASAVRFENGAVLVAAPFPPGEKQVAISYDLPAGRKRLVVPVDQPSALVEVLAEDSLTAPVALLTRADPMPVDERVFQRFVATDVPAGARPAVALTGQADPVRAYWWLPVVAATLLLGVGGAYAASRRVARR